MHLETRVLWNVDEVILFFAAIVVFCAVLEIAFRLGRRYGVRSNDAAKTHSSALQAALLGLLALLVGFNFAMAVARFDARKALIQEEVNAINTTSLRAQLLPPPQRQEAMALLRAYVTARVAFGRAEIDKILLEAASVSTARSAAQLWTLASAVAAHNPNAAPTVLFIQAVNDMINVTEKRRAAEDNHVPEVVLYLLLTVAVGALGFIAYGSTASRASGATARPRLSPC
jgi:hypothetical protein